VPIKAVLSEDSRKFVFVVNGSIAHKKEVKTGTYQKDSVEIVEGLKETDLVIVEGNYGLKDSTEVEINRD
jgi:multidrug efflux pump subunit AcrA (membrane-fusion protein)